MLSPLIIVVVGFLLAWFRLTGTERGALWAEDAAIFSARALDPSLLTAGIFTPYAGYTHALPQIIASAIWTVIPAEHVAIATSAASCLVAASVGALVFRLTDHWRIHPASRVALASISVLSPGLAYEALGNLANLHWLLLFLSPFLFLAAPRSWWGSAALAVVALLVVATEIQAAVFAPLLLWRLRAPKRWPLYAGAAIGALIQAWAFLNFDKTRGDGGRPSPAALVDGYFLQAPLSAFTGSGKGSSALVAYSGWDVAYVALVPFLAAAVVYGWRRRSRALLVTALLGASVVIWGAGFWLNFYEQFDFAKMGSETLAGGVPLLRYSIVPIMLLWAVVALAVGGRADGRLGGAGIATLVIMASVFAASYHVDDGAARGNGPTWGPEVENAARICSSDAGIVTVTVPAAPDGWFVDLPCDDLR